MLQINHVTKSSLLIVRLCFSLTGSLDRLRTSSELSAARRRFVGVYLPSSIIRCKEEKLRGRKSMSSLGTSKGILEIAKFGMYVTVPIFLMYTFANNTKNIQKFMGKRSYVEYPPEGPRPPSPEELREMARELARKRENVNH